MLVLGHVITTDVWREAGIEVDLMPLDEATDRKFLEQTVREVREGGKLVDVKQDVIKYAQLIGRHCIKGWRGVVNESGEPVECTPDAIDEFMTIPAARERYVAIVKSLRLRVRDEVEQAKKGSPPS